MSHDRHRHGRQHGHDRRCRQHLDQRESLHPLTPAYARSRRTLQIKTILANVTNAHTEGAGTAVRSPHSTGERTRHRIVKERFSPCPGGPIVGGSEVNADPSSKPAAVCPFRDPTPNSSRGLPASPSATVPS